MTIIKTNGILYLLYLHGKTKRDDNGNASENDESVKENRYTGIEKENVGKMSDKY